MLFLKSTATYTLMIKENDASLKWEHLSLVAFYFCLASLTLLPKPEESWFPPSYSCLPREGVLELVTVVTDWATLRRQE